MPTNDHTVPQSYLRRFARKGRGKANQIIGAPVNDLGSSFTTSTRNVGAVKNFHWGTDPDGVPHHTMEKLMTAIESAAAPAFSELLDTDYALPARWPPRPTTRVRLSWWIAAQILRTTRQRKRLDYLASKPDGEELVLDAPTGAVRSFARNNEHLSFIAQHLQPLAAIIAIKPWGVGFSDSCIPTSDVPVVVMNGQDADHQLLSVAYLDIVLPLDPHRFLILPAPGSQDDPATLRDHRVKLDGGLGRFVADLIWSSADQYLLWHPDHEPQHLKEFARHGGRLPQPWAGDENKSNPMFMLQYGAMSPDHTVERRWFTEHPPHRSPV